MAALLCEREKGGAAKQRDIIQSICLSTYIHLSSLVVYR
jgi:hypothetical protein